MSNELNEIKRKIRERHPIWDEHKVDFVARQLTRPPKKEDWK